MGQQLMAFYEKAKQAGQFKAQLRLAMLTLVPGEKAKTEPDTPELVQKFQKALDEVLKEFK